MSSRTSIGSAVPARPVSEPEEVRESEEQLPLNVTRTGEWSCRASFADQFSNPLWRNDVRPGVEKVAVFKLPDQQDEANQLLARGHPPGSPQIMVMRREPMRVHGDLVLFVVYQEIEYRQIIPTEPA
jgi:hypothetical protein